MSLNYYQCKQCGGIGCHNCEPAPILGTIGGYNAYDEAYRRKARETSGLAPGDSRTPEFGEWMRGIWASERNPIRDGMYVRTIRRKGQLNPGVFYELTDGKGKFWEFTAADTLFLPCPWKGIDAPDPVAEEDQESGSNEGTVRRMVERFLCWELPAGFAPDAGISFAPPIDPYTRLPVSWPTGTNLFNYGQAEGMVRHMLGLDNES